MNLETKNIIKKMNEDDLHKSLLLNPIFKESVELSIYEATPSTKTTGPDGFKEINNEIRNIEIKTSLITDKQKTNGYVNYSDSSMGSYDRKVKANGEIIIASGWNQEGDVIYRFEVEWFALAEEYKRRVSSGKKASVQIHWRHFINHKSFKFLHIAEHSLLTTKNVTAPFLEILLENKD